MSMFVWPVRVYYENTDSGGVVYHADYLKYMEQGRTEWLRKKGFEQDELIQRDGILFAVRSLSIEYLKPAKFNNLLAILVQPSEVNRISLTFTQRVIRVTMDRELANNPETLQQASEDGEVLVTAQVKVVSLDAQTMKPRRMPQSIVEEIAGEH